MAGGIYEQSEWPDSRSDYVQVCDGCHTAIWSTRWNEETSDGFDAFLARNGWRHYFLRDDLRVLDLCPTARHARCVSARFGRLPIAGSARCAPTRTPTRRSPPNCPPRERMRRTCC